MSKQRERAQKLRENHNNNISGTVGENWVKFKHLLTYCDGGCQGRGAANGGYGYETPGIHISTSGSSHHPDLIFHKTVIKFCKTVLHQRIKMDHIVRW